ncbi:MAG: glycosyltransferase family 1 protein [Candidatus Falkowbacteria bacterium]|nr:glycosyltransferase family 1 protein [Candidatus Falkowbacteria bacterium]
MKIGIDIRTLMDKEYSGVSEYTLRLVNSLLAIDKINHYKLFYNSFADISSRMPVFNAPNAEVIQKKYPNKLLNYGLFYLLDYPKVDKAIDCDVFFMPHINFMALSQSTPSVLTIHDLSFMRYPEFFSKRKNFWHKSIDPEELVKKFKLIIAISENTKRDIVELLHAPAEKVVVIHSGLNKNEKNIDEEEVKMGLKKKKKYLLYLGTIEPRKNIESIIQAYEDLRNENREFNEYKLVIAGGSGWKCRPIIESAQNSRFSQDIILLGYIKKEYKKTLYKNASVFIAPSFYEGFGFPQLEAIEEGTPVITSNTSSMPEIFGESAILINPMKANEIKIALKQIINNNEIKNQLITSSHQKTGEYDWEKVANKYLEEIMKLQNSKI